VTWSLSVSPALDSHCRLLLLVVVERVVLAYMVGLVVVAHIRKYLVLMYAVGWAVVAQICGYVVLMWVVGLVVAARAHKYVVLV